MDKKEAEDIKDDLRTLHKILWNENREGTYTIQKILEYIYCLEQKESILDKVTDKLKKVKFEIECTYSQIDGHYFMAQDRLDLANEILSIIEGDENK